MDSETQAGNWGQIFENFALFFAVPSVPATRCRPSGLGLGAERRFVRLRQAQRMQAQRI